MRCPRGDGVLAAEVQAGMEIDRCSACQGVWLDVGEGELVTRPSDELPRELIEAVAALDTHFAVPDTSAPLPCPRCEASMQRERYADSQVEIDRCGCGVWLDGGEQEKIAAYRLRCLDTLQARYTAEGGGPAGDGWDLAFSAGSLERAFARVYFDVGGAPEGAQG